MGGKITFADRNVVLKAIGADPQTMRARLAASAVAQRDAVIKTGEANPRYLTLVDGREGGKEESVRYPNGRIQYDFAILSDIAGFAIRWFSDNAPVRSGDYKNSFFVMIDNERVADVQDIPVRERSIIITNDKPYSRKIQVGATGYLTYANLFDHAANAVRAEFGEAVGCTVVFIELPGGYVSRPRQPKAESEKERRGGKRSTTRYPSLVILRG